MPYEVNNCLGITQFVTGFLNEDQAVLYLLGIDSLSLEEWLSAKTVIPAVNQTKRQSKETAIRDLAKYFINDGKEVTYVVENLAILPGLQVKSVSYIVATIESINAHIQGHLANRPSRSITDEVTSNTSAAPPAVSPDTETSIKQAAYNPVAVSKKELKRISMR